MREFNRGASALFAMFLLTGCAGNSGSGDTPSSVGTAARDPLPPASHSIPFPDDRLAAGLTEYLISGANAEQFSAGAVPSGSALLLDAASSGNAAEWALYRFNPGANRQDSVSVLLDDAVTTGAFIGLANYATQRWDFSGPYTGQKSFLTDNADYLSPAGNQWVAVLAPDGGSATVNALSIRTINPDNIAPTAALSAGPLSGNAPLTVSFDASASSDPDGGIIEYAWDFNGDGLWDGFSDDPQVNWTYTAPGIYSARVRVTDEQLARSSAASVEITVNLLGNDPPVADLQADVASGNAPLTVNFDAAASGDPDGGIVRYDWDFDGDGAWDSFDAPEQAQHTYSGGSYTARLRVTDDAGAQDIAEQAISVNLPPLAALSASLTTLNPGETSFLDAAGSSDPDGSIADYEWDLDGDGEFNDTAEEAAAQGGAVAAVLMGTVPGLYSAAVRVTDDSGATTTAELTLTIRGWLTLTVDAPGDVGWYTSLADVNGRTAISYRDVTNNDLKYAYSSMADGSSGWTTLTVDATGSVGLYTSLALVNGRPAISYRDVTNGDLKYAYSSAADGSGGWLSLTVDATGEVGYYTSLAVVNGSPAISYGDNTNGDLKYAYSNTADGSSGWSNLSVDGAGDVGWNTSLAVVNGRPAISYYDNTNGDLKYAHSSTADGSTGWNTVTVDALGTVGEYTSLAVVNGRPAISYYDNTSGDLKYAYSNTADGSGGWISTTVDAPGNVGMFASLAVVSGRPAISYRDVTNSNLKYAVLYE